MNINTWLSVWIRRYRKAQNSRVLDQNEKTERKIKNIIIQLHQVEYKHRGNWEQISCDFVRLFGRSVILYCIKTCLSSRLRVLCYKIFDHALNCATWEVWRALRKLKLKLLSFSRALQTSRVHPFVDWRSTVLVSSFTIRNVEGFPWKHRLRL